MKTLIVYFTKYGATKVCAKRIAEGIKGEVNLINIKEQPDVSIQDYDNIVIGCSVYAGMLNKRIKSFCTVQSEQLKNKRVFLFLSCMDQTQLDEYVKANLPEVLTRQLLAKVSCGGAFYFTKMNFFEKFIIKAITNSKKQQAGQTLSVDTKKDMEMFDDAKIQELINRINE